MKHLFVSYKIAKQLKEKGFNEDCLAWYTRVAENKYQLILENVIAENILPQWNNSAVAPLYQQVIDWFREKHKIGITVDFSGIDDNYRGEIKHIGSYYFHDHNNVNCDGSENYYEAFQKVIEKALTLI